MKALFLALLSSGALAQPTDDWQIYSTANDGVRMAFSPSRTSSPGQQMVTWVSETMPKPRHLGETPEAPLYQRIASRVAIDCAEGTLRYTLSVFYSETGATLLTTESHATASPVLPGSTGEMLLYRVCTPRKFAEAAPLRNMEVDRARCALSAQTFYAPMKQALLAQQPLPQPQQPLIGGTVIVARASPLEGMAKLVQMDSLNVQERDMADKCLAANGWPTQTR